MEKPVSLLDSAALERAYRILEPVKTEPGDPVDVVVNRLTIRATAIRVSDDGRFVFVRLPDNLSDDA